MIGFPRQTDIDPHAFHIGVGVSSRKKGVLLVAQQEDYLTAAEVADILRVKPVTVARMCADGELPATRPVKSWLIAKGDLEAFIAAGTNQPAAS